MNREVNTISMYVFPFNEVSNDDLLALFERDPLDFKAYCQRTFNPFTEPDVYSNSYDPDVNFDHILECSFECEFHF